MHFRHCSLIILICALSGACGPKPSAADIAIDTRSFSLIEQATRLQLALYERKLDCELVLFSMRRPGVYNLDVDLASGVSQFENEFFDIVPGTYTAAAWAFGGGIVPIGFACTETPVVIEEGRQTQVTLILRDL